MISLFNKYISYHHIGQFFVVFYFLTLECVCTYYYKILTLQKVIKKGSNDYRVIVKDFYLKT